MIEFAVFGAIFIIIGIALIIDYVRHNAEIKNSREVSGKIVDFIKRTGRSQHGHMHTYIYPVYEYYDDGEFKKHESNVSVMPPKPLGTEVTLYIDHDGKVREAQGTSLMVLVGVIFAVVGAIFAVIALAAL